MAVLETSFSCALALLGYFRGRLDGIGYSVFGKTRWPEILLFAVDSNFTQNWLNNFGEFLLFMSENEVYKAHNIYSSKIMLQSLLHGLEWLECHE